MGVQNKSPENVPLWHVVYFELKAIETLWTREKYCSFLNYLEEFQLGIFLKIRVINRDKLYLSDDLHGKANF